MGLEPVAEQPQIAPITGVFRSGTTGTVIQLCGENAQQVAVIDGDEFPLCCAMEGTFLIDRYARSKLLVLFTALTAMASAATALASGFGQLLIAHAVVLVSGLLGAVAGGGIADACQKRWGPRKTAHAATVVTLLYAVGGLFPRVSGAGTAVTLLLLLIAGGSVAITMATALAVVVVPAEFLGLFLGAYAAASGLSWSASPLLVSLLSGALGGPATMGRALAAVTLVASALACAAMLVSRSQ